MTKISSSQNCQSSTGKEEVVSDVRFIHAHFVSGIQARATVAWKMATTKDNGILLGISWCSPRDHFRKDKGRLIAEGRLNKKPLAAEVPLTEREGKKFVDEKAVLACIFWPNTGADIPRWAKDDALLILKRAA